MSSPMVQRSVTLRVSTEQMLKQAARSYDLSESAIVDHLIRAAFEAEMAPEPKPVSPPNEP
jgi:post-segregation antitoxin (ccd killing protein)